jgi:hypothetical protein
VRGWRRNWSAGPLSWPRADSSTSTPTFDAHFDNLLTDGRLVYFADFGLALSSEFELSAEEREFLSLHRDYDGLYVAGRLLRHHLPGPVRSAADHEVFLREWLAGSRPAGTDPAVAALLDRHAGAALVLDRFHRSLITADKRTPYPAGALEQARAQARARAGAAAG